MGKVLKSLLFSIVALFLVGCSDSVAEEIEYYITEELSSLFELELEATDSYNKLIEDENMSDEEGYLQLEEVIIPKYNEFLNELEDIHIESEELFEVHEIYVKAVSSQQAAMVKIMAALESGNRNLISEANIMLADGRSDIRRFNSKLKQLVDDYNLDIEWGSIENFK